VTGVFPYVLESFMEAYGGRLRKLKGTDRSTFRWEISGQNAAEALRCVLPFMFVKREQGLLVLRANDLPPGPYRDGVVAQLKALKHHDYQR